MKHSVADKIREKLKEQNLSVMGLERKAGLNLHAVQNILSGQTKKPNINTLVAVAGALSCSLNELVDEAGPTESASQAKLTEFTNFRLLGEANAYLISKMEASLKTISTKAFIEIIQEVYIYCEKSKSGTFDKDFANWMLDRLK